MQQGREFTPNPGYFPRNPCQLPPTRTVCDALPADRPQCDGPAAQSVLFAAFS